MSHDLIENLSEADQDLYSYDSSDLEQRHGLIYKDSTLNDDDIRFYYRPSNEKNMPEPTVDIEVIDLEESFDIPLILLD